MINFKKLLKAILICIICITVSVGFGFFLVKMSKIAAIVFLIAIFCHWVYEIYNILE